MLTIDIATGALKDTRTGLVYADRPYRFMAQGRLEGGEPVTADGLTRSATTRQANRTTVTGRLEALDIEVRLALVEQAGQLEETLTIRNAGGGQVHLAHLEFGFCADLNARGDWTLTAVPFKVQLDGSRHAYSAGALAAGEFKNAVFEDNTRQFMPPLTEEGSLRSEAWMWGGADQGLLVIKYNIEQIELSVACPVHQAGETWLKFGGAGFCLYAEPSGARVLAPGQEFTFGTTTYLPYAGGEVQAYALYREFLDVHGHTFPPDYNPPVNWNELYDIGWYHSRADELRQNYTRQALLGEAAKASAAGCELLYLDPGWEVCEGTTLWDESRLGTPRSLAETLVKEYGLGLGYRTVLRTYQDHWPKEWMIRHTPGSYEPVWFKDQGQYFWEPCLCNPAFWEEKLKRILAISREGIRFMMVDEFDWRGPCHDPNHGHAVPTTPLDHARAVYRLCSAIRAACPDLTIETHDPIWPWATSIYVPTYFQHGFGTTGSYDENWGFEYMWDCLNDLKSGRALALYYYNLGCSVPIYLHITMAADNDACVFFWWVASTVRHVGIGGKVSHKSIEPGSLPARDPERRFNAYAAQLALYRRLKPYFVRGTFHGISETAHLHTLPGTAGGVLNVYNLTETAQEIEVFVARGLLQAQDNLPVEGADAHWQSGGLTLRLNLPPMSPAVICIGESVRAAAEA